MFDLRNKNIYVGNQAIDRVYLGEELLKSNEPPIYMATDEDFKIDGFRFIYIGSVLEVDITDYVNREGLTRPIDMFSVDYGGTPATKIVLGPSSVTRTDYMFRRSQATILDVSSFDTSSVANMSGMFYGSQATILDVSSFDTSSVTDMSYMFWEAKATTLDLSSFDTSSVTNMRYMFSGSQATSLDLSNFDTSSATNMGYMFQDTKVTTLDLSSFYTSSATDMWNMFQGSRATIGYARTQADANRFNSSGGKPSGLTFVVHPDLR